ncbi:MAG: SRPBCC family protein [Micrococcales bacterium]|nr:SRPBCC family protein [Micrococcales bacterium]
MTTTPDIDAADLPPTAWATVRRTVPLAPAAAWQRLTTLSAHEAGAPLTTMHGDPMLGPDARFRAVTRVGPLTLSDPMRVTHWRPPTDSEAGALVIDKSGRVLRGRADIQVRPVAGGCEVVWREAIWPAVHVPALLRRPVALASRAGSGWLFARVLDAALGTEAPR